MTEESNMSEKKDRTLPSTFTVGELMDNNMMSRAVSWVAEVNAAYADGGYASGDGPEPPLEEMEWLMGRVKELESDNAYLREGLRTISVSGPVYDEPPGVWSCPGSEWARKLLNEGADA